jgi:TonB family protein
MLFAPQVRAQQLAVLSGYVTDSSGAAVSGAKITVSGSSAQATSDDGGEFRLVGLAPGLVELRIRRLGFVPISRHVQVTLRDAAPRIHITLGLLPNTLKPVLVQANRVQYSRRLAGYYERLERRSSGVFIDRAEIDSKDYRSLTQLLSQSPGISSLRIRAGGGSVRMRGRNCRPLVWLDGVPMPAGEVDLDAFPVSTIQGIELYLGSTTAPSDYTAADGQSSCGTILLWSRGPDTEQAVRPRHTNVELEGLAASLSIYTAAQVDSQAYLRSADSLKIDYPPSLFAAGVEGTVIAEFVVDSRGDIEPETFNIVSSSHPLFVEAVGQALERASYSPAIKDGRQVRQLVHQPFSFIRRSRRSESSAKH